MQLKIVLSTNFCFFFYIKLMIVYPITLHIPINLTITQTFTFLDFTLTTKSYNVDKISHIFTI